MESPVILYNPRIQSFHCDGCMQDEPVHPAVVNNPERLTSMKELIVLLHCECHTYATIELARDAMAHRKDGKWKKLLRAV